MGPLLLLSFGLILCIFSFSVLLGANLILIPLNVLQQQRASQYVCQGTTEGEIEGERERLLTRNLGPQ